MTEEDTFAMIARHQRILAALDENEALEQARKDEQEAREALRQATETEGDTAA